MRETQKIQPKQTSSFNVAETFFPNIFFLVILTQTMFPKT